MSVARVMDIRKELGVNSIKENVRVRDIRLRWYGHIQRMEESNEVRAVADMIVPGKTKREMDGWRPRGHGGTADHPGGCPGQSILDIKNSGR